MKKTHNYYLCLHNHVTTDELLQSLFFISLPVNTSVGGESLCNDVNQISFLKGSESLAVLLVE